MKLNQKGFTVTELTIAVVVAAIISIAITTVVIVFYGNFLKNDTQARVTIDSQIILRNLVDELRMASAIRSSNTISDTYSPVGGWNTDANEAILIIALPAQDVDGIFLENELTGNLYENEIVYFAQDQTLYRRILAHPDATGNTFVTTCPAEHVTPTCPEDRLISDTFSALDFMFYDQDNTLTSDENVARSIDMTIHLSKEVFGSNISADNNIRMTLRNRP